MIVHEATHARLRRFGYPESQRQRIEKICMRRELAFTKLLPTGGSLSKWVSHQLENSLDYSTISLEQLRRSGEIEMAEEFGIPIWIVDVSHKIRDWQYRSKIKRIR